MHSVKYVETKHGEVLKSWLYGHKVPMPSEVPEIGRVVYQGDMPVAMTFLRRVEGGYAQVDGLCSNPEAASETRDKALDTVINHILRDAKSIGITQIISFTQNEHTLLRAIRHGFAKYPAALVVLDLNKRDNSVLGSI